jgi:hypothetical protein
MSDIHLLARARRSFEQHTWADSYRLFEAADREVPLEPEDLERLATAAYLMGREDASEAFWERAHRAFLEHGDREGAARSACWLAVGLQLRGAIAPASGWFARAQHILDEGQIECVVRGFLLIPSAFNASCRVIRPPETRSSVRQQRSPADMGIVISNARPLAAAGAP